MIVYTGNIKEFKDNIETGMMTSLIEKEFKMKHIPSNFESESRSWDNSLRSMYLVLNDPEIDVNLKVAIEYQIPTTSKRVDFIITGKDDNNRESAVIVELKQWSKARRTSRRDIVTTYLNKMENRPVVHPSYQAYSYVKTIENYSEYVQDTKSQLIPCAYLHNYKEDYREEIDNDLYKHITEIAPLFLQTDIIKLRDFIKKYIKKPDDGHLLYGIENGKIKPSKALQDALVSMLKGNREFYMIDEQQVVFSTIKKVLEKSLLEKQKYTVIVEGGPGTGKSVLAINLLVEFKDKLVHYVTKNAAPRNVYFAKLMGDDFKKSHINNLFKSSGAYINTDSNFFDCLLVDEAHRLNEKSGMFAHLGENQIKEIINASKVSVFFIDEDQMVTTKDFGSVNEIKKQAKALGSKVLAGEEYNLVSQFRCNGSDGYLAFLDDVLEIRETANYDGFNLDYDLRVYSNPNKMREVLRAKNKVNNKARMLAGYCYDWVTKKNPDDDQYDIYLEDDFKAKWNFNNTKTFAIDEDSFEQVGCIHTSQGLEFDYVGVIIGKDLRYKDDQVVTDFNERAKTDHSLKGIKKYKQYDLADKIIRNTYRTLLTRGQKGCFIYCEDKELETYLRNRIEEAR